MKPLHTFKQVCEESMGAYLGKLVWRAKNQYNPYSFRGTLIRLLG